MVFAGMLKKIWNEARDKNRRAIVSLVGKNAGTLLDCGCDDGAFTMEVSSASGASRTIGIEINLSQGHKALKAGVEVVQGDLNKRFPLEDELCDVVVLNQVIEHLPDTDHLLREINRVLKPGGFAVISTENLASWPNVASLVLGWQPFSLTNISSARLGIGNPMAAHRKSIGVPGPLQHRRVMAPKALVEICEVNGLPVETFLGAGYFPFTGQLADFLCRLDNHHAAFMNVKCVKPHVMGRAGPR
ncbi:MAG: methyltransferase domain-containing protein [Actinobacteria bacterium]|nr:methyltransferase domain-containing protein [Actinomycetota bacterium]